MRWRWRQASWWDGHEVGSGFGEVGEEGVGVLDHHVAVEGEFGDGAQGLHHGRAEGDVGNEVAVHDVNMENGGSAALGCRDFVGKVREVGGEDGCGQFDHRVLLPVSLAAVPNWLIFGMHFGSNCFEYSST